MRLAFFALLALPACDALSWGPPEAPASESGMLMSTSNTWVQLDSAAMSDDGEKFFAVMGETTWCSFVSDDAYMDMDTEADTTVEVQDIYLYTPLVATPNGLEYINEAGATHPYWEVRRVSHARFRAGGAGAVAYTDLGVLRWFDGERVTASGEVGACAALDLDREGDVAWLACSAGVVRATPAGASTIPVDGGGAGLVAWSDAAAMALAAGADLRSLTALDPAGEPLWTASLDGRVMDLVAIAGRPLFAALVKTEGAATEVALISADTGDVVDRLPTEGTRLRAAHDAARLVIHGESVTAVYDVE